MFGSRCLGFMVITLSRTCAPSALRLSGICLLSLGDVARFTHFVSHISVMPHPRIYLELAEYIVGQGPTLRRVMTRQSLHYARVQPLVGQHLCLTVPDDAKRPSPQPSSGAPLQLKFLFEKGSFILCGFLRLFVCGGFFLTEKNFE